MLTNQDQLIESINKLACVTRLEILKWKLDEITLTSVRELPINPFKHENLVPFGTHS